MGVLVNTGASFTFATLIVNEWLVTPPSGSVATITTLLLPTSPCKGVPDNVAVLSPLSVNVNHVGLVGAVIDVILFSISVTVISYV